MSLILEKNPTILFSDGKKSTGTVLAQAATQLQSAFNSPVKKDGI
jgi:hypothetical protein